MSNAVPQGWSELSLKEVSTVITKGTTPTTYGAGYAQSGVKFIRVENISKSGFIDESELRFISKETHETLKRSQLQSGDLLVSIAGAIGRSAIVSDKNLPANTNQAVGIVRLIKEEIIADFARYSIESPVVAQQMSDSQAGNAQVNLNLEQLGGLRFYRPPLPEQQKIATILSSVDDVIEKTRAQIDKLKDLKTGMMQELLTKGIGHTEFKDSPVGQIPAEWSVVKLKDIADVKGGKRMPKGRPFAGHVTPYPYIRVTDFRDGTVRTDNLQYVLPEDQKTIKRYIVGKDDLYISIAGTLGLIGSIPDELDGAQLTENAAKIVFHDQSKISPVFYKHILLSAVAQDQLSLEKGIGGGVPKLALFRIEAITLPLPTFEEQNAISKILDAIDVRIQLVVNKIKAVQLTKKALMQDLLTGKVRVKPNESAAL